jgi:uncharacterized glyoxalase superfamily protein PhnB
MLANRSMPPGIIIPELAYKDVTGAAQRLCSTFGFSERLRIGNHRVQLSMGPESLVVTSWPKGEESGSQPSGHHMMIRVEDVDLHHEHVRQAGANILSEPETFPFGERQYSVEDIGGHRWTFTQSVADVAPEDWGGEWGRPA